MRGLTTELKVGFFALAVLGVLAFMTFKVGGLEFAKAKGYSISIVFDNVAGLNEKTRVKVAGVEAGVVEGIDLEEGKARVKLKIYDHVKLYKNARASIKSTGLLGDKYLDIDIGSSDYPLMTDNDVITRVAELVDMDDLAKSLIRVSNNFTKVAESLYEVLGTDEAKRSLSETITNLRDVTASMNSIITVNDQKLRSVLDNIDSLTRSVSALVEKNREPLTDTIANVREFSGSLRKNGPELVENLNKATNELKALVEENRPGIRNTVETAQSIARKLEQGEGSLGKLLRDDRLYESVNRAAEGLNKTLSTVDRFRTFITFQSEYLTKPKDAKGHFYVTLQPEADKYYILGVVSDPVASVKEKETTITPPGTPVREEVVRKKVQFTAQFAKRFGDAAMRIGMTESTFGVGGDYFLQKDRVRLSADVWDFSNDEEGAKNPHFRVGADYFLNKNLFISAGLDNILNKRWRGGYMGMGLKFEDEDFKHIFSTLSRIPAN